MDSAFSIHQHPKIRQEFAELTAKNLRLKKGLNETLQDACLNLRGSGNYRKLRTFHHRSIEMSIHSVHVHRRSYEISIHRAHVRGAGEYRLILAFVQIVEERRVEIVPLHLSKEHITDTELIKRIEWVTFDYLKHSNWEPPTP